MKFIDTYKIPSYAVCAIDNGDYSGLEEEDIKNIDEFLQREFPKGYVCGYPEELDMEPYFTTVPAFGKAGEVVDIDFYEP